MSGIVGVYRRNQQAVTPQELQKMAATMAYRGPDGRRFWQEGPVGLGALLLWTTPQACNETLPLARGDGNIVITADARLDNRDELAAKIGFDPASSDIGDAAFILAAYERWGTECPQYLLGDFAFVIWDAAKQRVFCARDHMGVKQLYYFVSPRLFAFATEIKALLALPDIPNKINETRVGDLLTMHVDDMSATLYQDIYRLPPATSLSVAPQGLISRVYWRLDPRREIRMSSDAEYAEAYRAILSEAVRCRMRAPQPVATALSGGLDSTSITALVREMGMAAGSAPLHTISAVYDQVPECDERDYINAALEQGNLQPLYAHPEDYGPLDDLVRVANYDDEPIWNPQSALAWAVYTTARRNGIKVVLEGVFGDDVVGSGQSFLNEMLLKGRLLRLWREANRLGIRYKRSASWVLARQARQLAPPALRRIKRRLQGGGYQNDALLTPLATDFVQRSGLATRWASRNATQSQPARSVRQSQWRRLTNGLFSSVSLPSLDRHAALAGVEMRQPFLDVRLVEFCLAVPAEQKLRNGWSRWIALQGMAGLVPDKIRWRTIKSNLAPAFRYGLLEKNRALLDEIFLTDPGLVAEYIDMKEGRRLYQQMLNGANDSDEFAVWSIAQLALWLRREHA